MRDLIKKIASVSLRTLFYLFIVTSLICVLALRHNNARMLQLRDAVYTADKSNGDVNKALNDLRGYIYGHMNTNLASGNNNIKPPIQLKYTYQRLYNSQLERVQANNQAVYSAAQIYCHNNAAQNSTAAQLGCIQNYAVNHGVKDANINIPAGLYQFDFVSPTWSPDLAGWALVLSVILFIALVAKLALVKFRH